MQRDYYLFRGQRLACEIIATGVEAFLDDVGVHFEKVLHLFRARSDGLRWSLAAEATHLLFLNDPVHVPLLGVGETRKVHG